MNFYAIGPLAYLNEICGVGYPFHMCLAQYLYDKDYMPTDYFMYYRRRASMHTYKVILDNGAYEDASVNSDLLLRAATELNPDVLILPDSINNMGATLTKGEAFKMLLKRQAWRGKTMTVVQAERGNTEQWVHSYMEACKQSPWVGIPRNQQSGLTRACFMQLLKERKVYNTQTIHHALGMVNGDFGEMQDLNDTGLVKGIDSSNPIWRGLTGGAAAHGDFNPYACNDSLYIDQAGTRFREALAACK